MAGAKDLGARRPFSAQLAPSDAWNIGTQTWSSRLQIAHETKEPDKGMRFKCLGADCGLQCPLKVHLIFSDNFYLTYLVLTIQ